MLGIIDTLCRGVLHFLLLGVRLYSVWDLPMFLRLQLVSFRKVHDLCWGLLIFCVILCLLKFRLYSVWDLPMFLRLQLFSFRRVHDVCWGLLILCVVVYYGHALGGAAWGRVGLSGAE